ncbi:hypothetical protein HYT92_02405 [Candidatus Pacearchaeota archaeon]|nr:hypothetical protein [Candidatus Pacearchaeota archaeon]
MPIAIAVTDAVLGLFMAIISFMFFWDLDKRTRFLRLLRVFGMVLVLVAGVVFAGGPLVLLALGFGY